MSSRVPNSVLHVTKNYQTKPCQPNQPQTRNRLKINVLPNYGTKPTDQMWAKRDRPPMKTRVSCVIKITKRTHPIVSVAPQYMNERQTQRGPDVKILRNEANPPPLPLFAYASTYKITKRTHRVAGRRSQTAATGDCREFTKRSHRVRAVPGFAFKVRSCSKNCETNPRRQIRRPKSEKRRKRSCRSDLQTFYQTKPFNASGQDAQDEQDARHGFLPNEPMRSARSSPLRVQDAGF
jgi:hypothetical protein